MTRRVENLTPISEAAKSAILDSPRTADAHRAFMSSLDAMQDVQTGGNASVQSLPAQLNVVAWNVERCLFPEETAATLASLGADIVLLSEVDNGMSRTSQRNTTKDMADALGMEWVYGVEFFEMSLGSDAEKEFFTDDFNALGFHGNGIMSKAPLTRVELLRLDDHGQWFDPACGADPDQPRIGGRMALLAEVPTDNGPVCVVSTHLESNAQAPHRHAQMQKIIEAVDAFAPDMPVIIGGDLNTGNHMPPDFDWQKETLFGLAEEHGYTWSATADGPTTRPSLITRHPDRQMKLDWFATRGFDCLDKRVVSSLDDTGRPLSDHDAVYCKVQRA